MVSERPVGRPPKGESKQAASQTARRSYVVCKLAGRHDSAFLTQVGVSVNTTAVGRAGTALMWHPEPYRPPGPKHRGAAGTGVSTGTATPEPALRDWLAIDYAAHEISLALITLRATTRGQQQSLYATLRGIDGVLQALLCKPGEQTRMVLAVAAWDGETDARRLTARLDELDADWSWQAIELQTVLPTERTWRHLARLAATAEGLRL